ncbi:MAG: formylglycine-generating enzyme family protein [Thermoguttaceae bacterium]
MSIVAFRPARFQSVLWALALGWAFGIPPDCSGGQGQKEGQPAEPELTDLPAVKWMPKPYPVPNADAATEAEMKDYTEVLPSSDIKFDMVAIKGGTFKMGSPPTEKGRKDDEGPQVEVTVEPFWIGKYEVTWDQYEAWAYELDKVRRKYHRIPPTQWDKLADAIAVPTKPYTDMTFGMGKERRPAVCMTQFAAQMFCKWLCAKTGRYYRLPTEAEWEYACRAGTTTAYSFGDDPGKPPEYEKLRQYAVFVENSNDAYARVGTKKPNAWGLYDMHGNVAEWVLDQYIPDFYKKLAGRAVNNPLALATTEFPRVVRGGSWDDDPPALRSAARRGSSKEWKAQDPQIPQSIWYMTDAPFVGFRVLRPLRMPTEEESRLYEPDPKVRIEYVKAQGGRQ